MTNTPADQAAGGPSNADLEKLVAQLAQPAAMLLHKLLPAAVAILRGMLDEAYERGRTDERADVIERVPVLRGMVEEAYERGRAAERQRGMRAY